MKFASHASPTPSLASPVSRRQFVTGVTAAGLLAGTGSLTSTRAIAAPHSRTQQPPSIQTGNTFNLDIGYLPVNYTGKPRVATAINGSVPGTLLRWKEGDNITLNVTNSLSVDSSIHWHGLILPNNMDGVPGLTYDGIKPGETFQYRFDAVQSGTYWYHSHSGFQEQTGAYGAIIIDPKDPDPVSYDREHIVLLSDWSDEAPEDVFAKLKKMSHYYNFRERTAGDLWQDIQRDGIINTWSKRGMWNRMRMSETDIADVTGYTYTFLMNGITPEDNWQGAFSRGEKVRLRFINAAAMTIFDVRIPGLKMTVVATDGQNIQPVSVDEFRIGVAETYDVIVEPSDDQAYCIFAQTIDRTGYSRGTLTPNPQWRAEVPPMDPAPILGHRDMGMDHSMHDMGNMEGMDHSMHDMGNMEGMKAPKASALGKAGAGSNADIVHAPSEFGPHIDMRAESPADGLHDPGIGLRDHQSLYGRKVLTYGDIKNLYPTQDTREPSREIQLHLTGNMSRYMWSMNGIKFADAEPLTLTYGERVRITLVNDTMMTHPIHLHGLWSELETGDANYLPRKHTIIVQPGSKISYLVTADAKGRWAFHCHLLFHMPGMFREVRVR